MGRTFFTLALMAALLLARGAGATSIGQDDGFIYDAVRNARLQDGTPCGTVENCVDGTDRAITLADVNTRAANLSSGGFTDKDLPSMEVNGDSNRLTANQGPLGNLQSKSSTLLSTPAMLLLVGVGLLSLGGVLRRLT